MRFIIPKNWKSGEFFALSLIYVIILLNVFVFKDNIWSGLSAFFGITYTFLAGKGTPRCYLFGISGSGIYGWLAYSNAFWGNLVLYLFYYIPMQIMGYIKWNNNLKADSKNEIIKTKLPLKEFIILISATFAVSVAAVVILYILNDKNPIIDGITTIFSILGMYLTVRRCIEQWVVWALVNGLSAIMWVQIAINGEKVYSTVLMWLVYFILAFYFYKVWKTEVK